MKNYKEILKSYAKESGFSYDELLKDYLSENLNNQKEFLKEIMQTGGEENQVQQIIMAFAQATGQDPNSIMEQLQQLNPQEQQAVIQQMAQQLQGQEQQMQYGGLTWDQYRAKQDKYFEQIKEAKDYLSQLSKKSFQKGGDLQSVMGYRDDSPFKGRKSNLIKSNYITMDNTGIPLIGVSNTGDIQYMHPYSGEYEFDGEEVTEYPIAQTGYRYNNFDEAREAVARELGINKGNLATDIDNLLGFVQSDVNLSQKKELVKKLNDYRILDKSRVNLNLPKKVPFYGSDGKVKEYITPEEMQKRRKNPMYSESISADEFKEKLSKSDNPVDIATNYVWDKVSNTYKFIKKDVNSVNAPTKFLRKKMAEAEPYLDQFVKDVTEPFTDFNTKVSKEQVQKNRDFFSNIFNPKESLYKERMDARLKQAKNQSDYESLSKEQLDAKKNNNIKQELIPGNLKVKTKSNEYNLKFNDTATNSLKDPRYTDQFGNSWKKAPDGNFYVYDKAVKAQVPTQTAPVREVKEAPKNTAKKTIQTQKTVTKNPVTNKFESKVDYNLMRPDENEVLRQMDYVQNNYNDLVPEEFKTKPFETKPFSNDIYKGFTDPFKAAGDRQKEASDFKFKLNNPLQHIANNNALAQAFSPTALPYLQNSKTEFSETPLIDPDMYIKQINDVFNPIKANINGNSTTGQSYLASLAGQQVDKIVNTLNEVNTKNQQIMADNIKQRNNAVNNDYFKNEGFRSKYYDEYLQNTSQRDSAINSAMNQIALTKESEITKENSLNSTLWNTPWLKNKTSSKDILSGDRTIGTDKIEFERFLNMLNQKKDNYKMGGISKFKKYV